MNIMEQLHGLVIRQVDYRDNDKIITLLTDKLGKISANVPGGRSIKSKRMAACGLFCYSTFSLTRRGSHYVVSQASLMENFYHIREDVVRLSLGYYIVQAAEGVSEENLESGELLRLTLNTLYVLAGGREPLAKVKAVYELRLMCAIGQMPDLVACRECGRYEGDIYLLPGEGRLLCASCAASQPQEVLEQAIPLNRTVLAALRYIVFAQDKKIFQFHVNGENMRYLGQVTEQYLLYRLDRRFSSLDFLKTVMEPEQGTEEQHIE